MDPVEVVAPVVPSPKSQRKDTKLPPATVNVTCCPTRAVDGETLSDPSAWLAKGKCYGHPDAYDGNACRRRQCKCSGFLHFTLHHRLWLSRTRAGRTYSR